MRIATPRLGSSPLHLGALAAKAPTADLISVALVAAALLLTGCSSGPLAKTRPGGSDSRAPDAELVEARQRAAEWRQKAVMGEVETRRLKAEVARLEQELARVRTRATARSSPYASASGGPGSAAGAEGVGMPIDDGAPIVTGGSAIEEIELEEPPPPAPVERVAAETAAPRGGAAAPGVGGPATQQPSVNGSGGSTEAETGLQALYDRGYALFHQKRYADAERDFRQVLDQYPSSALADNALFWIGESRYARGDLGSALAAYSETLERFPEGNKASHALYKAGRCLEALGRPTEAVEAYRELQGRFGGTAMADLADERLRALRP